MSRIHFTTTFIAVPSSHYPDPQVGGANWLTGEIKLEPDAVWETVIHEMGHILDGNLKPIHKDLPLHSKIHADVFDAGSGATDYGRKNPVEDFADSFLAVIKFGPQTTRIDQPRIKVITALIQSYTNSNSP